MICTILKKLCGKVEKIKIEKATVKIENLEIPPVSELPEIIKIAINELGVKEHPGQNHNPRIIEYHKACDLKAKGDEIAWCSSFVNWCFKQLSLDRTNSAAAISWTKWGEKVNDPKLGDVVIFRRVGSSWRGHVGFYVSQDKNRVLVLGGNQRNEVSFQWYPKRGKSIFLFQFRRN